MSSTTLHNFEDVSTPNINVHKPIFHPTDDDLIGHFGFDSDRDERMAMFPRNLVGDAAGEEQHYFRKFDGYAISKSILDMLSEWETDTILIVEKDGHKRVFEYGIHAFYDGIKIAYDPTLNTIIEGEKEIENSEDGAFEDQQYVAPLDEAKREWSREEIIATQ